MAVAVFGPSQSGKSYLISALARRGTEPVLARFGATRLDFVRDINPEGGQEATGLITRFTLRPAAAPEGAPVPLRLLSQSRCHPHPRPTPSWRISIPARCRCLPPRQWPSIWRAWPRALAPRATASTPTRRRSCANTSRPNTAAIPLVAALGARLRPQATALAPALSPADRAELYAPLWNREAVFTAAARSGCLAATVCPGRSGRGLLRHGGAGAAGDEHRSTRTPGRPGRAGGGGRRGGGHAYGTAADAAAACSGGAGGGARRSRWKNALALPGGDRPARLPRRRARARGCPTRRAFSRNPGVSLASTCAARWPISGSARWPSKRRRPCCCASAPPTRRCAPCRAW